MNEFNVTINTPKKQLFKGAAEFVNIPSEEGYMTILAGHAPLLANLKQGIIAIHTPVDKKEFSIIGGFIEVSEKGVTLLIKQS